MVEVVLVVDDFANAFDETGHLTDNKNKFIVI